MLKFRNPIEVYTLDKVIVRNGVPDFIDVTVMSGGEFVDWPTFPVKYSCIANKEFVTPSGKLYLAVGDSLIAFVNPYTGTDVFIPQNFFVLDEGDEVVDFERIKTMVTECLDADGYNIIGESFGVMFEIAELNRTIVQDARIRKKKHWY